MVGVGVTLVRGSHVALSASDLTVPTGAVTALIGPNGSGKSTLLHAVAGLLPTRNGTLTVFGRAAEDARTEVRYVPQVTTVNERLPVTVAEVVAMARYASRGMFGRLGRADRSAVAECLERLQITDLARRHLRELSGGQRQRVAVAQGLAQEGELLLLDEPLTGLDLPSAARILEVVAEERAAGRTVVLSTHDLAEAGAADHVLLLGGRIIAAGPPGDVLTASLLTTAYGGSLLQTVDGAVLLDLHSDAHGGHSHGHPG